MTFTQLRTSRGSFGARLHGEAGELVVCLHGFPDDATTFDDLARELVAAVTACLHNVDQHAGTGARAFVLVEDEGEAVLVTVRDDGVGIGPGRLEQAEADGRLGVSSSVRGRVEDLGG